ncbi:MAG: hypothetical protein A2018_04170 [Alphaproteobacteria bacterium GWF2_58_20]|nr:MAG: hypothetical protein A2018_04170 [Alphaproteobacteria bacterium GWF2_58_20]
MIIFNAEEHVPYTAKQMFDLVSDIEKYPEFVPGCRHVSILWREESRVEARMQSTFMGFSIDFTSKIILEAPSSIEISNISQPFRRFFAHWSFEPRENDGCIVSYKMEIETPMAFMDSIFSSLQGISGRRTVAAFMERAKTLYDIKS